MRKLVGRSNGWASWSARRHAPQPNKACSDIRVERQHASQVKACRWIPSVVTRGDAGADVLPMQARVVPVQAWLP